MDEQHVWAPWRIGYIKGDEPPANPPEPSSWRAEADQSCFLCRAAADYDNSAEAQRQNLVVRTADHTLALLNKYPYTNGHLLIAPLRHVAQLHELTADEHLEAMLLISEFTQTLATKINAQGFNVGLNLGEVAGAGVPGHLHWHLVPRWPGDNNFMPTLAGTRVISQSLDALWEALATDP